MAPLQRAVTVLRVSKTEVGSRSHRHLVDHAHKDGKDEETTQANTFGRAKLLQEEDKGVKILSLYIIYIYN